MGQEFGQGMGFPGGSEGKESACNAGDLDSVPGLRRTPGGGHGNPLQYSCLEYPHGQRSMAGYSPWGCKESGMTERLSIAHNCFYSVGLVSAIQQRESAISTHMSPPP